MKLQAGGGFFGRAGLGSRSFRLDQTRPSRTILITKGGLPLEFVSASLRNQSSVEISQQLGRPRWSAFRPNRKDAQARAAASGGGLRFPWLGTDGWMQRWE
jgi:hypothetical protein